MEYANTNATKKHYQHFTLAEREELALGLEKGESPSLIAKRLGKHRSSVSREIKRNTVHASQRPYRASSAHNQAQKRALASHQRERLANPAIRSYGEEQLKLRWSPQRIAGRLARDTPALKTSYETIYQWVYHDRRDLIPFLLKAHQKRHKRPSHKHARASKIPHRTDIAQRPLHIASRTEAGHGEADTVVSRYGKAVVAVFVERSSRLYVVIKMKDKTAQSMHKATIKALSRFPAHLRKTITYDNGTENTWHELTNQMLGTKSYFCKPYHSWEKGSVENRNGILRRYFPKHFNWDMTTQKKINKVVASINATPMVCLDYRSPAELFAGVALAP